MEGTSDSSNKDGVLHTATSQSIIRTDPETLEKIKDDRSLEINLKESAKIAAILASKKSWEFVPYSFQKRIDNVKIDVSIRNELIEIIVEVRGIARSSLAIESISAASAAAITMFDKLRNLESSTSIESLRLLRESNVLSELKEKAVKKAAILIISNSEHKEKAEQVQKFTSDKLVSHAHEINDSKIIEANQSVIETNLKRLCDEETDLIITCGGIELKDDNLVSKATEKILDSKIQGIPEIFRAYGIKRIPSTIIYEGVAGIRSKSIIVNLPGNIKKISELLDLLFPYLSHIYKIIERN